MSSIRVGDTVAFKRNVVRKCNSGGIDDFRATVTAVSGDWLFMTGTTGQLKVMPRATMCKVAHNGVILELV